MHISWETNCAKSFSELYETCKYATFKGIPVFVHQPMMATWKLVPKSILLRIYVMCTVQNLTPNTYVAPPSGAMLQKKLLHYIPLPCLCNYFRSPPSFKTSWVMCKVTPEVWDQFGMTIDTVRERPAFGSLINGSLGLCHWYQPCVLLPKTAASFMFCDLSPQRCSL